jgi:hypothetical protein
MLPKRSATGRYSDAQYDLVRGYILLVHAEVENYLEDSALTIVDRSLAHWVRYGRVNRCISALLLHHEQNATPAPKDLATHIYAAANAFRITVRENHGIREPYLWKLLLPVGIDKSEVSPSLLAELESFGVARGSVAHSAKRVQTPPDPGSTMDQATQLVGELSDLDQVCRAASTR